MFLIKKRIIGWTGLTLLLAGSLVWTYRELKMLEKDESELRQEWTDVQKIFNLLKQDHSSIQMDEVLQMLGEILKKLEFKNKILHIQPSENEIEIALQNLSQNDFIALLKSLDRLKGLDLVRVELTQSSIDTLSLLLTIKRSVQ